MSPSMPTSSMFTMFSWETLLAASASRLNRRTNSSSDSYSGRNTLMATTLFFF